MGQEVEVQYANLKRRMTEMLELRTAELACVSPARAIELGESHRNIESVAQFRETLWELELALEDRGWVREVTLSNLEFSRLGIQQLVRICRIRAIKNPIVKRASIICRLYVFGRGVEIRSDDDATNNVIQAFLEKNKAEIGHTGLASKEQDIQTDGSLYFGLPTKPDGTVTVNMIDALEIMDVATDPDDVSKPIYFFRQWNRVELNPSDGRSGNTPMKCWYPSLELVEGLVDGSYAPEKRLDTIGGIDVNWDMPILRSRDSETPSKWRWAVPPLYALIDWASAYKDFLEDWATIQRTLSRFALMIETKGGQGAIAAYQALLSTTFANSDGTQIERNPPPVVGSAHVSGPDNKIQAFKSAGASTSPEQARRLLLMGAAAAGLPETFFGDASTGSLATAVSLDRPTELKFSEIQRRWKYDLECILRYVVSVSKATAGGKLREAQKAKTKSQARIIISFPTVIEHAIQPMIQAIFEMATCGGRTGISAGLVDRRTIAELMLTEIGYEDRENLLDKIYGKNYDPAKDVTDQRSQVPPQNLATASGKPLDDLNTPPPLPPPPPVPVLAPKSPKTPKPNGKAAVPKEALLLAVDALREAVNGRHARN